MPCDCIKGPDGSTFIVCSREHRKRPRCSSCGRAADYLCDYQLQGAKFGKTCDRPLCGDCRRVQPGGKDLCPAHHEATVQTRRDAAKPSEAIQQSLALTPPPKLASISGGKSGQ